MISCFKTTIKGRGERFSKMFIPFRKHAYSNIVKTLQPKKENFQIKNSDIFNIPAQNIDCGYSLERLGEAVLMSTNNPCFLAK